MKTIDAEIVKEAIVACAKCGQKNRLYQRAKRGNHRCGSCKSRLPNPFARDWWRITTRPDVLAITAGVAAALAVVAYNVTDHPDPRPYSPPDYSRLFPDPPSKPVDPEVITVPASDLSSPTVPATPPPDTFIPANNAILFSELSPGESHGKLTVSNGTSRRAIAKLIAPEADRKILSFVIGAGEQSSVTGIPDGSYKLLFAFGDALIVNTDRFVAPKGFSRFDQLMSFTTTRSASKISSREISVTLNAVGGGNATTSTVSEAEFDRY